MKKFKKLIPAFCMLLASAVMLGTSTFAWFTMNNNVSANGMEVTATANTNFLVISKTASVDDMDKEITFNSTEATGGVGSTKSVYPCAFATADKKPSGIEVNHWYTATSTSDSNAGVTGGLPTESATDLGAADATLNDYHITYTFHIGMAENYQNFTGNLKVTGVSAAFDKGVAAYVKVGENAGVIVDEANHTDVVISSAFNLNAGNTVAVTVKLFIDGNNDAVYNTNLAALTGSLNLTFTTSTTA